MTADHRALAAAVHGMLRAHSPRTFRPPSTADPAPAALPRPRPLPDASLERVLAERRSTYRFTPPDVADLADLLAHACGSQRTVTLPDGTHHIAMVAPSAGGLPSLDIYVVDLGGHAVPAGVHRYDRIHHRLYPVAPVPTAAAFGELLTQPQFAQTTGTFLVLTARLDTTLTKYPARHYRTLHVDTGVLVSSIYLVATALGLRCCAVTGFFDDAVDALLRLDDSAFTTAVMPFGRPAERRG